MRMVIIALVTFFGYPDNDPPGAGIAKPIIHKEATEDVGDYSNPITAATALGVFGPATVAYIPRLRKYVIIEDTCGACDKDAKRGVKHIDIFVGSNTKPTEEEAKKLLSCQFRLTNSTPETIIIAPPPGLPVDPTPLCKGS
jgi:isocitrate lyase